jgi:hypothetical protein
MRLAELAVGDEPAEHFRGGNLTSLAARFVNALVERDRRPEKSFE